MFNLFKKGKRTIKVSGAVIDLYDTKNTKKLGDEMMYIDVEASQHKLHMPANIQDFKNAVIEDFNRVVPKDSDVRGFKDLYDTPQIHIIISSLISFNPQSIELRKCFVEINSSLKRQGVEMPEIPADFLTDQDTQKATEKPSTASHAEEKDAADEESVTENIATEDNNVSLEDKKCDTMGATESVLHESE